MTIKQMLYTLWTRLTSYTYQETVIVNSPQLNVNTAATVEVDITDKTRNGYKGIGINGWILGSQHLGLVSVLPAQWVDGAPTKLSVRFVNRGTSQIPIIENRFVVTFIRK